MKGRKYDLKPAKGKPEPKPATSAQTLDRRMKIAARDGALSGINGKLAFADVSLADAMSRVNRCLTEHADLMTQEQRLSAEDLSQLIANMRSDVEEARKKSHALYQSCLATKA